MKLAVASGKGGTGKTLVATNLFHVLRKHGYEPTLVDCDAEAPNALSFFRINHVRVTEVHHQVPVIDETKCTFCGKCHEYCRFNAIFILPGLKVIHVLEDLCHGCGACTVACKYGAIAEHPLPLGVVGVYTMNGSECLVEARMKIGAMSPVPVIRAAVDKAGKTQGTLVLDSPPGTACPFIHTVASADYVILVTEPTPFGLSDLQQSVETLKAKATGKWNTISGKRIYRCFSRSRSAKR